MSVKWRLIFCYFYFSFHIAVKFFYSFKLIRKISKNRNLDLGIFKLSCTPVMTFFFESARATSTSLSRQTKKHWLKIRNAACFPASLSAAKYTKKLLQFNSMKQANTHVKNKMSKEMAVEGNTRRKTLKHWSIFDWSIWVCWCALHIHLYIQHPEFPQIHQQQLMDENWILNLKVVK